MTVFKGYMKVLKKNAGLILLYLMIFFCVAMALQAAAGKETYSAVWRCDTSFFPVSGSVSFCSYYPFVSS